MQEQALEILAKKLKLSRISGSSQSVFPKTRAISPLNNLSSDSKQNPHKEISKQEKPYVITQSTVQTTSIVTSSLTEKSLERAFFMQDPVDLAQALLGKIIVRNLPEGTLKCRIVETEAYCGVEDKGSHAYGGKITERTSWLYQEGGHLYIYSIHGHNYLMNVLAGEKEVPGGVLIRAVEPIEGLELIKKNRNLPKLSTSEKELTNGPGKLCKAMQIDKKLLGYDVVNGKEICIVEDLKQVKFDMHTTKRVNIDYAEEFVHKLWRFYISKNTYVSVK